MISIHATVGWFCRLLFARAHISQFETEISVSFTTIPLPFPSASFLTLSALIWPKRRSHNFMLDESPTLAYSIGSSGRIASRNYRLWSALNGKCSPFALSEGNADIIVSTLFASAADEDRRLRPRPGTNTTTCSPLVVCLQCSRNLS